MKITALYNTSGAILAAVETNESYDGPIVVPVASRRGTKVSVFEVPEFVSKLRIDEICMSLRVDVRSGRLIDATRSTAGRATSRARVRSSKR